MTLPAIDSDRRHRRSTGPAVRLLLAGLLSAVLVCDVAAGDRFSDPLVPGGTRGTSNSRDGGRFQPVDPAPPSAPAIHWQRWQNPRYGFALDLPDALTADPPPTNGDGRTLRSADGRMVVKVFGQHNAEGLDLGRMQAKAKAGLSGAVFDYERMFSDNFVLSGVRSGEGFYLRVHLSADGAIFTHLLILHPEHPSSAVSTMVTRLSKSLVASQGDAGSPAVASKEPPKPPPQPTPQAQPQPTPPPQTTGPSAGELERLKLQAEIERLRLEQLKMAQTGGQTATPQGVTPTTDGRKDATAPTAVKPRGKRVALVIGNGAYAGVPKLPTSANDAARMSAMLQVLGFDVVTGTDRTRGAMTADLATFYDKAKGADVALFYFSGHGLQINGKNYLLPIDATFSDPQAALDVDGRAVDLQKYLNAASGAHIVLAFVDACRDNPIVEENLARTFYKGVGGPTKGLAVVKRDDVGSGQFIGFAADEGKTAQTGDGEVSVYTAALLKLLPTPGEDVSVLHRKIRREVETATSGKQSPHSVDDLREALVLVPTR